MASERCLICGMTLAEGNGYHAACAKGLFGSETAPAYDLVPVKAILPADKDDLALTVNGKNRKLRAGDFKVAAATMGLTPEQDRRLTERMVASVRKNLDEATKRSFLSPALVKRIHALVHDKLRQFSPARPAHGNEC